MRLDRSFGRRLLARLYLYQAILFLCIGGAIALVGHLVLEPALRAERRDGVALIADGILSHRRQPAELGPRLVSIYERMGIDAALFAVDGRLLAKSERGRLLPLDAAALSRLEAQGTLTLGPELLAVGALDDGHLSAYVVARWVARPPPIRRGVLILCVVLGALLVGSALLAQSISAPLEQLSRVTQQFGLGDLRARTGVDRSDEIGDVARAFNQMAERIETLRRSEKELLANVSHELRTPLARIRVVLELTSEEVTPAAHSHLCEIAEDLTEMEDLLGDIISTARLDLDSGRLDDPYPPLRLVSTPLGELLAALAARFRELHADRPIEIQLDLALTARVDRVMLKHAISNVLDNANKYGSPRAAIALRLTRAAGDCALIELEDRGPGIDPADVPRVFAPFFRADRSRARDTGGVGLGLTLARRIVDAHGGTLSIASELGRGSVVRILLPLEAMQVVAEH